MVKFEENYLAPWGQVVETSEENKDIAESSVGSDHAETSIYQDLFNLIADSILDNREHIFANYWDRLNSLQQDIEEH